MSFRLRLTLWYAAVVALTLVGGSVALYLFLAFNVIRPAQDQLLAARAGDVAAALSRAAQAPPGRAYQRDGLSRFLNRLAEGDLSIVVRGQDGAPTDRSANLEETDLTLSPAALAAARSGQPFYEDVAVQGVRLRLYTVPVRVEGQTIQVVQAARPTRQADETLAGLRDALLMGNTVLVLLGAAVGWFLAGRSLEPVRRITRTAREIERSGQLDRRVEYRGPRDDLGELAIAFNSMLSRLEATFAAQRRFVSDASHELRTPLTTLRVNIEVLRKERAEAPPAWGEVLDDVALELERLSRLAQGLLELARADAGRHLERAPLELDPLLERVERQASQLADGVAVSLEGPPVGRVVANADALTQLFLILLDNALKYTPRGGRIALERGREDGFVQVCVRDTGPGIPTEELSRIFDRFYRAPSTRGRPGTGLGLPIARWIAEEHGGRLTAESAPGRGSVFTVWLPAS